MGKYKVGGVAGLFPEPKESTTETGKKLQSLFSEFNSKRYKKNSQSPQKPVQDRKVKVEKEQTENESRPKKMKRKFSSSTDVESNVENIIKKFKKENDVKDWKPFMGVEVKGKNSSTEVDFPRRKKKGQKPNFNPAQNNSRFEKHDLSKNSKQKQVFSSTETTGLSNNTQNIKPVPSFIRKSKNLNAAKRFAHNHDENTGTGNFAEKSQHTLFYEKEKQNVKKKFKNSKQKNFSDTSDTSLSTVNEKQNVKKFKSKQKNVSGSFHNEFLLTAERKNKNVKKKCKKNKQKLSNCSVQKSGPAQPNLSEPDFIKVPEIEDEEEVLSRTLFVGNLPTNTTRKALKGLFSTFGPVESVRYFGIETDKNKIYKRGGPQQQNLHYAAESLPGFIIFKDRQSAVDALSLSGSIFEGHHITVDFAMPAGSKKLYDDKRSIFIGNLPFNIQDEIIWNAFGECGKIEGVRIVRDRATGIGKGFGYVLFSCVQSKENALQLQNFEIQGRPIRINAVKTGKKSPKKSDTGFKPVNRDPFKSRAIQYKKKYEGTNSRKSVKKIMEKNKKIHKKKKIASILLKSMK